MKIKKGWNITLDYIKISTQLFVLFIILYLGVYLNYCPDDSPTYKQTFCLLFPTTIDKPLMTREQLINKCGFVMAILREMFGLCAFISFCFVVVYSITLCFFIESKQVPVKQD